MLIRVFADRVLLLQPPGYPKRDKREPFPYWMDVYANLNLTVLIVDSVMRWHTI